MTIRLIDVPMDLGASERGVSLGPTAIRLAGLQERLHRLGHRVVDDPTRPLLVHRSQHEPGSSQAKYLQPILDLCLQLQDRVYETLERTTFPIVLGGDHSLALGSIAGVARYHRERGKVLGILWIDAHGDYNTPATTLSGNLHGMPLAILNGLGDTRFEPLCTAGEPIVLPQNTVLMATRDLDPGERELIRSQRVTTITMMQIDRHGIDAGVRQALSCLENCDAVHVSWDMDAVDPRDAPGVGTPVSGGLTLREAHYILESLAETRKVCSLDLVEVNPLLDHKNQTACLAVELVASLLGSRIL